jgi:hypothetical protein
LDARTVILPAARSTSRQRSSTSSPILTPASVSVARIARLGVVLAATKQPNAYDGWARRRLARWLTEAPGATIDRAAEVAAALADLPAEPQTALETIRDASRPA